jgi:hypothetical protein
LAIQQNEKVRPVLNLSAPHGHSFNDNVNEPYLEKVHMSSVKQFAVSLMLAGRHALFSKYDLVDAYKNVPVRIYDLRLQGFSWLSKFFVETRQIFGAKTAVSNYDIFGNTLLTLANTEAQIPKLFVHRALDDVPVISPRCRDWCIKFDKAYCSLCKELNVKLAEPCEKFEKAFVHSTFGKVLGYFFESKLMAWKLPDDKRVKYKNFAIDILKSKSSDLLQMQTLMGYLNHAGMFAPLLKGFKFNLNKRLGQLQCNDSKAIVMDDNCLFELRIWCNFLAEHEWHPLGGLHFAPPLVCKSLASDAAGHQSGNSNAKVGCGNIGFDEDGCIMFANQFFWPLPFIQNKKDKLLKNFGSKSTTLEFIGILIPFLLIPEKLSNQYIVIKVDNAGCFFGWLNRQVSGDETASIFVRALHLISCIIGSDIHIEHLPRVASWEAMVVDRMSRESTTTGQDRKLLASFKNRNLPKCLLDWFENPVEDWNLAVKIAEHVEQIVQ